MDAHKLIEINIKLNSDGTQFITDFTLPTGETIVKNQEKPFDVGFNALKPYEGYEAKLRFSNGRMRRVILYDIKEDEFTAREVKTEFQMGTPPKGRVNE